jgi:hypothetical protein
MFRPEPAFHRIFPVANPKLRACAPHRLTLVLEIKTS